METNMIWANLGVDNLERTQRFYTALGFRPNTDRHSDKLRSFIFGENNFVIHFFLKNILVNAMKISAENVTTPDTVMFSLLAKSKEQVNEWADRVRNTEGQLVSEPESFGEGYYGFVFTDPDGNRFNVFCM